MLGRVACRRLSRRGRAANALRKLITMSCLVRATRLTLRGFQRHQPLPERLLLFPPRGYVTNDGYGSEHLAITIRGEVDGELDGDPPPSLRLAGTASTSRP